MKIETKVRYGLAALLALPTAACAQVLTGVIATSIAAQALAEEPVTSSAGCAQCHVEAIPLTLKRPDRWSFGENRWRKTETIPFHLGLVAVFERAEGEVRKFYWFEENRGRGIRFFLPSKAAFNPHTILCSED